MTDLDKLRFMNDLIIAGIRFTLETQRGCSLEPELTLDAPSVLKFSQSPVEFKAKALGLTPEEYRLWDENEGAVYCAGTTAKGKPCKRIIKNSLYVEDWREFNGGYCRVHGG